jgi:protein-tyrosine phosphatase
MFENRREDLVGAYQRMLPRILECGGLPETDLASEHFFDDIVFGRIMEDQALPYPGRNAILLEFYENTFPTYVEQRLFDIQRRGLRPVIAHPERYRAIWRDPNILDRLVSLGSAALLDTGSLAGMYGRQPKRCARQLLERGLYHAACSDAHRPKDAEAVAKGMRELEKLEGPGSLEFYYRQGPSELLKGLLPD